MAAPRAYWKGTLKLSLVSCPVALYPASTTVEKTRFHMINRETGNRLKQQMVDTETGDIVEGDVVRIDKDEVLVDIGYKSEAYVGFDCSGLTSWAYKQAGLDIPRVAADQTVGRQVSYEELQPGDLVLWSGHAAMYAGDGMMIEAGSPVQMNPVRTENLGMTFRGFWRPTG